MQTIEIISGAIPQVTALMRQLPEFDSPCNADEISSRISDTPHLILVAMVENQPAGFKVGYERDGYFYSWLGGVLPAFRKQGIARALAVRQETWAARKGYRTITFKTRNRHKSMLLFALQNGYDIIGFEEKENREENRIWLRKEL